MLRVNSRVSPRFVTANSLTLLEKAMDKLILDNSKQYDFYQFFQFTDRRGQQKFAAAYREELMLETESLLTKDKK